MMTASCPPAHSRPSAANTVVSVDRVEPLQADFSKAAETCEQIGRGSAKLIANRDSVKRGSVNG